MSTPITAQDIKSHSETLRPFWDNVLERYKPTPTSSLYFSAKICYTPSSGRYAGIPCARVFPFELRGAFFELINFDFMPFTPGVRQLVRLNTQSDPGSVYEFINNGQGGQYLMPVNDFELIYTYDPSAEPAAVVETIVEEAVAHQSEARQQVEGSVKDGVDQMLHPVAFEDADKPDLHLNQLTARDKYCLDHSIPDSNKAWINEMVVKGNAYKASLIK